MAKKFTYTVKFNTCKGCPFCEDYTNLMERVTKLRCEKLGKLILIKSSDVDADNRNTKGILPNCPFLAEPEQTEIGE